MTAKKGKGTLKHNKHITQNATLNIFLINIKHIISRWNIIPVFIPKAQTKLRINNLLETEIPSKTKIRNNYGDIQSFLYNFFDSFLDCEKITVIFR